MVHMILHRMPFVTRAGTSVLMRECVGSPHCRSAFGVEIGPIAPNVGIKVAMISKCV